MFALETDQLGVEMHFSRETNEIYSRIDGHFYGLRARTE
jgi:hypothetical protein